MMAREGEKQRRIGQSRERERAQEIAMRKSSRRTDGYKVDFPNYLNPYRQVAQPKRSRPGTPVKRSVSRSEDKHAYYQQLHQEVEDYRKYRNHRPFKRTEVPSIWQHTSQTQQAHDAKVNKQSAKTSPPDNARMKQPHTASATTGKTQASNTRSTRNVDFSGILSREPEISEQTFKQRYVTEDRDLPPYLKKEMNGENKRHEH